MKSVFTGLLLTLLAGAAHAYLPMFSPAAFFETLAATRTTVTVTVPTMLIMLVTDSSLAGADVSTLRTMIFGASPMDPEWIRRVAAACIAVVGDDSKARARPRGGRRSSRVDG